MDIDMTPWKPMVRPFKTYWCVEGLVLRRIKSTVFDAWLSTTYTHVELMYELMYAHKHMLNSCMRIEGLVHRRIRSAVFKAWRGWTVKSACRALKSRRLNEGAVFDQALGCDLDIDID
jgi:hypothetical protein